MMTSKSSSVTNNNAKNSKIGVSGGSSLNKVPSQVNLKQKLDTSNVDNKKKGDDKKNDADEVSKEISSSNLQIDPDNETKLDYYHALGFRSLATRSVQHMFDEDQIVYMVGQHVAIFNYEKRTHKFIFKSSKTSEIYCFAVTHDRKYIALSERVANSNKIQIGVYNFKYATRVRTLPFPNKGAVVSLDFSRDGKYLVASTTDPDSSVYLWHLEKSRRVAVKETKFQVNQISMSRFTHCQIATSGPDHIKIWKFSENELKYIDPVQGNKYTFTCHTWFDDEKLLVGTEEGHILVIEGTSVTKVISDIHPNHASIDCVVSIDRGFLCGGEGGYFSIFERTYDSDVFMQYKKFQTMEKEKIIDICVSKKEENVIFCYDGNNMSHFALANVDVMNEKENNFTLLPIGFHGDTVHCIDTCVQKSVLVSCGTDRIVRIWNYMKRSIELYKDMQEEVYSVSLDPTGTRLLVGFRYKLCLYNILVKDLFMTCKWQIKSCKVVKFSNGGHMFAAVTATNILIFSAHNFELLMTLRGHSGLVKALCWSDNDRYIVSVGLEGAVYEWDIESDKKKLEQNMIKSCAFHAVAYDEKTRIIACIGNDKKIWSFQQSELYKLIEPLQGIAFTSLSLSKTSKTLFVGTSEGKIQLYKWPLNQGHYREYEVHTAAVLMIQLSYEERYLFSVGADGTLFMLQMDSIVEGATIVKKEFNYEAFDDITYALKSILEEKDKSIRDLHERVTQVTSEAERKIQHELEERENHLEGQKQQFREEIAKLKQQIETLKQQLNENETQFKEKMNLMEIEHARAADETEQFYENALEKLKEKYRQLEVAAEDRIADYQDEIKSIKESHKSELEKLKEEYEMDKSQQIKSFNNVKKDFEDFNEKIITEKKQEEEEYGKEIKNIKNKWKAKLAKERAETNNERGIAGYHKSNYENLLATVGTLNQELKTREEQLRASREREKASRGEIERLSADIKLKDSSIHSHVKKIEDLKKQTEELEKLRYVLAFKFTNLKKEVSPKEELIKNMRDNLLGIDQELHRANLEKENLVTQMKSKEERVIMMQKETGKYKRIVDEKNRIFTHMLRDLSELATAGDPKLTNHSLKKLVTKYNTILTKNLDLNKVEKDKYKEFERQREYMEDQMKEMRRTLITKEIHVKTDVIRKTNENAMLVSEINQLRHERKELRQRIASLELQLKNATQQQLQQQQQQLQSHQQIRHTTPLSLPTPISGRRPHTSGGYQRIRAIRRSDSFHKSST